MAAAILLFQFQPWRQAPPQPPLKRHPASHAIRITAKLTFDGKPAAGKIMPPNDSPVFDLEARDLWQIYK